MDPDQSAPMGGYTLFVKETSKTLQKTTKQTTFVVIGTLTLNAPIATKVVCVSCMLEC